VIEPLLIIVIGLALGLVDQTSSEVSGMLRIPALVAALILVGQGLNMLELGRKSSDTQTVEELEPVSVVAPPPTAGAVGRASNRPVQRVIADEPPAPASDRSSMAWLVLGLAIWLGVATLAFPTAPLSLILLSLLAAYLLFAKGWRSMVPTRD
jgi:hypothetical protein